MTMPVLRLLTIAVAFVGLTSSAMPIDAHAQLFGSKEKKLERQRNRCTEKGWTVEEFRVNGHLRNVVWKAPSSGWTKGAILVLHGGGGEGVHFCAGGRLVRPQVEFGEMALSRGFAVIALTASNDIVTDAAGRPCGQRFDFSVLPRQNVDLPYIEHVIKSIVPSHRPSSANRSIFMTGLSTGGYMTIRASTTLSQYVTAFAPVSAGDPYGTDTDCDTSRSRRKTAKGVLMDRETRSEITKESACRSSQYANESRVPPAPINGGPLFKQFHDHKDGIVDMSCMEKVTNILKSNGYRGEAPFIIRSSGRRNVFKHLWQSDYNTPILNFFSEASR